MAASAVTIQLKSNAANFRLEGLVEAERKERLTLFALQVLEFVAIVFSIYYQPVVGLALLVAAAYLNDSVRETVRHVVHPFFFPKSVITNEDRLEKTFSYLCSTLQGHLFPLNRPISDVTEIEDITLGRKAKYLAFYGKDDRGRLFFLMELQKEETVTKEDGPETTHLSSPIAIYKDIETGFWRFLEIRANLMYEFQTDKFIQPVSLRYTYETTLDDGSTATGVFSLLSLNSES